MKKVSGQKPRILIAGIGNELNGDDGLRPVVISRLSRFTLPANVDVVSFGGGLYDLLLKSRDYGVVIIIDALDVSGEPSELFVVEPVETRKNQQTWIRTG